MIARYVKDFIFEASSEELYNKFYKDIKPDIYNKIIKADPTSTDKKKMVNIVNGFSIYIKIRNYLLKIYIKRQNI